MKNDKEDNLFHPIFHLFKMIYLWFGDILSNS